MARFTISASLFCLMPRCKRLGGGVSLFSDLSLQEILRRTHNASSHSLVLVALMVGIIVYFYTRQPIAILRCSARRQ